MATKEPNWDEILQDGQELKTIASRMIECAKAMGAGDSEEDGEENDSPEEEVGEDESMDSSEIEDPEYKLPTGKPAMGRVSEDKSINDVADPAKSAKKMAIIIALKKKLAPK